MRATVVDTALPGRLAIRDVPRPEPAPSQALVRVAATSLNRGETRTALGPAEDGWRPGWDLAGTVEAPARDGSGPPAGARVVGRIYAAAWAEFTAVPANALAIVPDRVPLATAAALPVAGLTALHALGKGGQLLGKRVLIDGASGGVGTFACRLAQLSGAEVVAAIRDPAHEALVRRLGADRVAIGTSLTVAAEAGPYDLILESIGAGALAAALEMLAPDGLCVLLGASAGVETSFDAARFRAGGTSLYGLVMPHELAREPPGIGLGKLLRLVELGRLAPEIALEAPWTDLPRVARDLMDRRFVGKAVIRIGEG